MQVTRLEVDLPMGRFYEVVAVGSTDHHVSIVNSNGVEFLIPFRGPYDTDFNEIPPDIKGSFGDFDEVTGSQYLDHIELLDVTQIRIAKDLEISTDKGLTYQWHLHLSEGGYDGRN